MSPFMPSFYDIVFFSAIVFVIVVVWVLCRRIERLQKNQFDAEVHVAVSDVEIIIDRLSFSSESLPQDTTYRAAYRCGYQAALLAVERELNAITDPVHTSNKQ